MCTKNGIYNYMLRAHTVRVNSCCYSLVFPRGLSTSYTISVHGDYRYANRINASISVHLRARVFETTKRHLYKVQQ